jgi:hypothetical protein
MVSDPVARPGKSLFIQLIIDAPFRMIAQPYQKQAIFPSFCKASVMGGKQVTIVMARNTKCDEAISFLV